MTVIDVESIVEMQVWKFDIKPKHDCKCACIILSIVT